MILTYIYDRMILSVKGGIIMLSSKTKIIKRIIVIMLTIFIVMGSAILGYNLTNRYKSTIVNAYNDFLDNISGKLNNFQNEILNETQNNTTDS